MVDVAFYQAKDDLGLLSIWCGLQHVSDDLNLMVLDLSCHYLPAHSISINDNLVREPASILLVVLESIDNKVLDDLSYLNRDQGFLDLPFAQVRVEWWVLLSYFGDFLFENFGVALSEVFIWCGAATNQIDTSVHHSMDTNDHSVAEMREVKTVEVKSHLGIHLLKEIRNHSHRDTPGSS